MELKGLRGCHKTGSNVVQPATRIFYLYFSVESVTCPPGTRCRSLKSSTLRFNWRQPAHEFAHDFWFVFSYSDAGVLRIRASQQVVHLGVCRGLFIRVGLWVPPRGLAIRAGRSCLVRRGSAAVVAGRANVQLQPRDN